MTEPKAATHASEGGHWYDSTGRQINAVPSLAKNAKPGQMVTRIQIRHAREYNLAPGVTTIMGMLAAYGLENWKRDQAIVAALTHPKAAELLAEGDDKALMRELKKDADDESKQAREKGTAFHAALQTAYDGGECAPEWQGHADAIRKLLAPYFVRDGVEVAPMAEAPCASAYGYGTKADLTGNGWVFDFKGKEDITVAGAVKIYDQHPMQLAATRRALRETYPDLTFDKCAIVFVDRNVPRGIVVPIPEPDLWRGLTMFDGLRCTWQAAHRYTPNW